ncbi:RNA polymerase II transcriptional coactivator KELP [Camellia lanceoleosa]|uniref:RNA polymerase II transcriptional coactivator KELP n=1 Tax=Camellia lanceoleosa TaxID=1840588 RepID=A0ACC0GT56_9ERIC|nr:RNA polymerase II transcriptional coactivator KELP [Camellia lanceoleosa]
MVIEILKDADLEEATDLKVRTMVAERLRIDLSHLDHKWLVRGVVELFGFFGRRQSRRTNQRGGRTRTRVETSTVLSTIRDQDAITFFACPDEERIIVFAFEDTGQYSLKT